VKGGNENAFVYPSDPVNDSDPSGCRACTKKDRWVEYVSTSVTTWGDWHAGAVRLFHWVEVFRKAMSYVNWIPGMGIEADGLRYRYAYWARVYRSCENGVFWLVQYRYRSYYAEGHVTIDVHAGPFSKKIKSFWVPDPYSPYDELIGLDRWR
jgi:hypothetical protein